jgi:hypothetical protein
MSMVCTTLLIEKMVVKIRDFPIVMYLSSTPVSVTEVSFVMDSSYCLKWFSQVPFPAISICPGVVIVRDRFLERLKELEIEETLANVTDDE